MLGPLLFILFINDLLDVVRNGSDVFLYAGDTKIFRIINGIEDYVKLQED